MKKQNKGITLIALVITVIILLILAGISIVSLTGRGLFEKAGEAKNKSVEAQKLENSILDEYEKEIVKASIRNVDYTKTNPIEAMPKGSTIVEGDANKGIVIRDSKENEWTWVEVPKTIFTSVKTLNKVSESELYNAIKIDLINYVTTPTNYRNSDYEDEWHALDGETLVNERTANLTEEQKKLNNGCGLTYYEYKENYEKMLSSVFSNGGFWISRYEIGDATATDSNTARIETSGITGEVVSRIDQIPYNYVTCSQAQTLVDGMKTDANKITSLLFGIQWDLTCKFIDTKAGSAITKADCKEWGNYYDSTLILNRGKYNIINPETWKLSNKWTIFSEDIENYVSSGQTSSNNALLLITGASEQTNKMNIYDFAGNECELTLEQYIPHNYVSNVVRGGYCIYLGSRLTASSRAICGITDITDYIGLRATLY